MYIHQHICIAPQQTNGVINLEEINPSVEGKLTAILPTLEGVPPSMLRRMSKAVKMGIGAGLPLIKSHNVDGIIIGTANGGMEDCIQFLNQIVDYNEGLLTPANFVQSTPNAIAGQLSLISKNKGYNATHVHNGLAFENALLDAQMLINENQKSSFLVGGVDEISSYNYNIDLLAGWYSKTKSNTDLFINKAPATIAGEGAAMFLVNNNAENAIAKVEALEFFQSNNSDDVQERFQDFLSKHHLDADTTLLISGENGDTRQLSFYEKCEATFKNKISIVRFKHVTGEYPTASAFGLWLACYILKEQNLPKHFFKSDIKNSSPKNIIIYNQYQAIQHAFMYIAK